MGRGSEGDSVAVHACESRAGGACHAQPAVPPPACPRPLRPTTARIRGHCPVGAPLPKMSELADGLEGVGAQTQGVMVCLREHRRPLARALSVGMAPPPPLLCSPSVVQGSVRRLPGHRRGWTPGQPSPMLPPAGAIASGSRRHLRPRFCGGSGCSGGGFLGR